MKISRQRLIPFLTESLGIESIHRPPTEPEVDAAERFLSLDHIIIEDVVALVGIYAPDAKLRSKLWMDVKVGNWHPMSGGRQIKTGLAEILATAYTTTPYTTHVEYETLHPFTDCNGRSGRMIWLWQMLKQDRLVAGLSFLHSWYYSSLENSH
mgnify:CR=1 FL=1